MYLVRILSQNLDVEIYQITQNQLIFQQLSQGLGVLKEKKMSLLILSFSLDLIARGARKVSKIKKVDNVFYFEKNLINPKSSIHFHPAQIVHDELIQFWMKAVLWQAVQKELEVLTYQKITSTIDSMILKSARQLPGILTNHQSLKAYDIQSPFHFSQVSFQQARKNFHELKIDFQQINQTSINFHKETKRKKITSQHWLIFGLALNILLAYLYWFPPKLLLHWKNTTETNEQLITLRSLANQDQHSLILELNEILSLIVEDYNEKIVNLYLENKNFTLIFQELSDQEINILSQRFDERNWTINKILNLNNQVVIEVSQP